MKKVPRRRQRPQLDQEKNKRKILEKHADKLLEQDKKNKKLSELDLLSVFE